MSRDDSLRQLFAQLDQMAVGFSPLFRDLQYPVNNYPPHNLVRLSDDKIRLELAVAGFKKNEIKMEEHQGLLTITGEKAIDADAEYQYRGIAGRSFTKNIRLADYFEISGASLEDGILTVDFIRNVPEAAKPKLIAIK